MAVGLVKRPLTVEQFNRMIESGIIPENDRVELIEGDIVEMAPIGTRHAGYVDRVGDLFHVLPRAEVIVRVQSPFELTSTTRVEPDLVVLRRRRDFYTIRLPRPEDVLVVVEVADTSLDYDRSVKIPAYAKAGIQEAWLVDITTDHVEVYRDPASEGYRGFRRVSSGEELTLLAFPDLRLPTSAIVGPLA